MSFSRTVERSCREANKPGDFDSVQVHKAWQILYVATEAKLERVMLQIPKRDRVAWHDTNLHILESA